MKIDIKVLFKGVFVILMVLILFTGATSADLFDSEIFKDNKFTATTLDFTLTDTANNAPVSTLFNITGIMPNGFKVEGIRMKKEGKADYNYRVTTIKTTGSDAFCQALQLTVLQNWEVKYQGEILNFVIDSYVKSNGLDDWIFYVSFPKNNSELINNTCDFNFIFKTFHTNAQNTKGFSDEEIFVNHITSGTWMPQ